MGVVAEYITKRLEIAVRENGLLIWLDKDDDYTSLVDELIRNKEADGFPFDILAFRGSFLQLMMDGRSLLSGKDVPRCVIHMPGFNEQEIRETPVLEAYKAGRRWRVSLDTMIREAAQGKLTEDQTDFLLSRDDLDLAKAEEFFTKEEKIPQEIKTLLQKYGEEGFVLKFIVDPKRINEEMCLDQQGCFECLMGYFSILVGMGDSWRINWNPEFNDETGEERLKYISPENQVELLISYMMSLEFVHDLNGMPGDERLIQLKEKSKESAKKSTEILKKLREQSPEVYIKWARRVESNLDDAEYRHDSIELGSLDTFRFEADIFLNETITFLHSEKWSQAMDLATSRLPGRKRNTISQTFWLQQDKERLWLWEWIDSAGKFGSGIDEVYTSIRAFQKNTDHEAIFAQYTDEWWKIDRMHRDFCSATEQYRATNSELHIKIFIEVRAKLLQMYRDSIDQQSELWNMVCEEKGFLPENKYQQRFFYKNWLTPVVSKGKKAVLFLVDALRYELGLQLVEELDEIKAEIHAMAAELPTITAVGMNALVPVVKDNKLNPIFNKKNQIQGFKGGSRQVVTPTDREKTFQEYLGKEVSWVTLSDFFGMSDRKLKRFSANDFAVVTVPEIDKMGESGALNIDLNYFNSMIMRVKNAVFRLKARGFEEFIITSDHGFLLGDETLKVNRTPKLDFVDRRHAYDDLRTSDRLISANPIGLQYEGEREKAFVFDRTTHILNGYRKDIYHGGNSLQERIIPVITCSFTKQLSDNSGLFDLQVKRGGELLGFNRITIEPKPKGDYLFGLQEIEIEMLVDDGIDLEIQEASGAKHIGNVLTVPVNKQTEILFKLVRGNLPRGKVFFEPTRSETILENNVFNEYFDVVHILEAKESDKKVSEGTGNIESGSSPSSGVFSSQIPSEFYTALAHLQRHGNLTESFLMNTLGGDRVAARKARKFNNNIDSWLPLLPFDIVIEQTGEGKVYKLR